MGSFYDVHLRRYSLIEAVPIGATRGLKTLQGYVSDLRYVFTSRELHRLEWFGTIGNLFPCYVELEGFLEYDGFSLLCWQS